MKNIAGLLCVVIAFTGLEQSKVRISLNSSKLYIKASEPLAQMTCLVFGKFNNDTAGSGKSHMWVLCEYKDKLSGNEAIMKFDWQAADSGGKQEMWYVLSLYYGIIV